MGLDERDLPEGMDDFPDAAYQSPPRLPLLTDPPYTVLKGAGVIQAQPDPEPDRLPNSRTPIPDNRADLIDLLEQCEMQLAAMDAEVLAAPLAEHRCRDVHGERWRPLNPWSVRVSCAACKSWAAHVADALAALPGPEQAPDLMTERTPPCEEGGYVIECDAEGHVTTRPPHPGETFCPGCGLRVPDPEQAVREALDKVERRILLGDAQLTRERDVAQVLRIVREARPDSYPKEQS